ncbi:phage portal protein [Adlercreutzia caecimuris]|uniref:phage portal protein n=1 Tax=Adlercreutzia caecimuris TaxID=671266 RepID=UPI001C3F0D84|nr:phage portal protein [Adlercreutzia caecimuris]
MPKRHHPKARARRAGGQGKALRVVAQGYGDAGASYQKRALKGFNAISGSPGRDIGDHAPTLRQRSRMLFMSSPVARSGVLTQRTNVVGSGLVPNPRPDADYLGMGEEQADEWARAAAREFSLWADDKRCCDATCVNNFYGMQQLVLMSAVLSGDVFALRTSAKATPFAPYRLRLRVIEADRVATPCSGLPALGTLAWSERRLPNGNIVHDGVEVDRSGAIVAYHVRNSYPQDAAIAEASEYVRVEAWGKRTGLPNVLHVMDAERPEQYRGVPYLAPVVEQLLQLRRYTESELVAAVVESFFTAFVKTTADPSMNPLQQVAPSGPEGAEEPDDAPEYEMGPGQVNVMEPGEDIVFADPKRPSSGFDGFVRSVSEQIGAALEIPADLLLKSFNSSYSAARAALLEAWKAFRMRRSWLVDDFCAPVWELWMCEAVATGRLAAPGFFTDPLARRAYLGCEWIGPPPGQLDPVKEITAEIKSIDAGLTTHQDAAIRLNGSDFRRNVERLRRENVALAGAAAPRAGSPAKPQDGSTDKGKEEDAEIS